MKTIFLSNRSRLTRSTTLLALLLSPFVLYAQNPRGSLRGTVQDTSGGRISSAKIVVQAPESALQRETIANDRGDFRIDDLVPGKYHLIVTANGFAEASSEVQVNISSTQEMTVVLRPQTVQQTVNVQGQASSITTQPMDTASAVQQAIITAHDLNTIPLPARSFANIAYMAPGTEPVEPSDPTKARITAVSTGGSSGLNNESSVDGVDNSDDWIGGFLENFSPESIQEFAIRTAQEDADTGRTTGTSVVITTKSGTNQWHSDDAFFDRAADLNARFPIDNPSPNPKQPFSRQNYVFTGGGPIVKDKVWFYTSFEYVHENASIAYSDASQTQFQALSQLAAEGLVDVNGTTVTSIPVPSFVSVPFRDYIGTTRFDWQQSARSQWFLRFSADSYLTNNALVQQGTLPSTGATTHNNYWSFALGNQFAFSSDWLASFVFGGSGLHLTQTRSSDLGFALAFPFSSTTATTSGLETYGDNQFVTAITAFPVLRNQEKYQVRYDVTHTTGKHAPRFGINFIHEPVMSGALTANAETLVAFALDPTVYVADPAQFTTDLTACSATPSPDVTPNTMCTVTPAGDGSFSQNVQRLGFYAEDSWRVTRNLTVNYGLRYDTTFGLFEASGRSQAQNPFLLALNPTVAPFISTAPHDYRKGFGPRVGVAYSPGDSGTTVIRAGFGMYYDDLAQNGWVNAFQAVNDTNVATSGGIIPPSIIDPNYHTPYAIHVTAGVQHAFNANWTLSTDFTLETGMHGYREYTFSNVGTFASLNVFRSDNRSSYKALKIHLQGNVAKRLSLVANYTLSSAKTWGCVLGELFDYVNRVCNPFDAFAPGDYGPSGEDVTHRGVLIGTFHAPAGFELSFLSQAESGRPITLTNEAGTERAVVDGVTTTLDEFRGTPYIQTDLRVSRPIHFRERYTATPFIEFFNLFNRNNPGANYVTNVSILPVNDANNVTAICLNPSCSQSVPVTSGQQLRVPAGALGDFFGPGTTVGIPFAAQLGVRFTF
ncbi:MAG TPA: carboxypeptidase regulatory-like domain-containing protein [Candidatus Acidoferrum sp.]|nr:carboxypeptidase regulatory-like domain-containing protein [Candidatus Acidoferrum sp.]